MVYDEAKVRERWGVAPAQIADVLALMGDAIDNIPGVKGVGEKTAVKLISQFGSVERLYENLSLVPGKLRETLAANRKQALLSRELATLSHSVPLSFDLEAFRRVEPDWVKLRALWMEMEFSRLLKELPTQTVQVSGEAVEKLDTRAALDAWLARVPAGAPLALEWTGESQPPTPRIAATALFHPEVGAASMPPDVLAAGLGQRALLVHDAKHLVEGWLAAAVQPGPIEDSAVASYLLNPARSTYRIEDVCMEAFGACPPSLPAVGAGVDVETVLGERARWLWRYWEHAREDLRARELLGIYQEVERPLVPVLALMERHGIRVDPRRLEDFAKELERELDNLTREIHA
ncbi:MAG: hypothetical protein L0Y64_14505, partial [Myxococcaceae bacterium]|nr:hypothetical protein [Myxococcaceae bacterium]